MNLNRILIPIKEQEMDPLFIPILEDQLHLLVKDHCTVQNHLFWIECHLVRKT